MLQQSFLRRCGISKRNTISKLNALNKGTSKGGFPRKQRELMKPIRVIHETPRVVIAGRGRVNEFGCNQFAVVCKKTALTMLVDASDDWTEDWVAWLSSGHLKLQYLAFTHLHMDNLLGFTRLSQIFPATTVIYNPADDPWLEKFPETCFRYGRPELEDIPRLFRRHNAEFVAAVTTRSSPQIVLGDSYIQYIPTPGHSMGHTAYYLPKERVLFSGDMIFYNEIGRVDLPWATGLLLAGSLRKLEDFHDEVVLLPGHGRLTTLGRERKNNLGLQRLYELIQSGKQEVSVGLNGCGFF